MTGKDFPRRPLPYQQIISRTSWKMFSLATTVPILLIGDSICMPTMHCSSNNKTKKMGLNKEGFLFI